MASQSTGNLSANIFTAYSNCSENSLPHTNIAATMRGQILDTRSGEKLPMPAIPIPPNDELEQFACVVTSTDDGTPLVTFAITATTPSSGLTPESRYTQVATLDGTSSQAVGTVRLPSPVDSFGLRPCADGGIYFVEQSSYDMKTRSVTSFEPKTLKQRAALTAEPGEQIYVTYDGYAATRKVGTYMVSPVEAYDQWVVEFFNGIDGSKLGEFSNVVPTDIQITPRGFLMYHGGGEPSGPGVFFFDMPTSNTVGPVAPYLAETSFYGDLLLLKGMREDVYLKVHDIETKREVFSFNQQQIDGLKIDLSKTFLGGQYLYVTNESDNPVIDLQTSQPVHAGWSLVPVRQLQNGWVLIWPEGPGSALAPQGIYPDSLFAARGASGDYDGPWF